MNGWSYMDFQYEHSLDLILSPGCYSVEVEHVDADLGLPIKFCGNKHYIVCTLIVTDNGTDVELGNRLTGQVLIITPQENQETKIYLRTRVSGVWSEWRSLAMTGMFDDISSTDELVATVAGLVDESIRAKEVEGSVKHAAVDISSLSCIADKENVAITVKSMDGEVVHSVEIPVATTEKAGLIGTADKIKVDSALDYTERLCTSLYNSTSLLVGNANNYKVGTKVTYGTLKDYRTGTFYCKAGQIVKIDTQATTGSIIALAFCDKDMVILQAMGKDFGYLKGAFVVPVGAEYIVVNCKADYEENFFLETIGRSVLPFVENTKHTAASILVGNANNYTVGTKVTYGVLKDYRTGTFYCKAGQIVKIDTQGTRGAVRPLAFCDKDMVVLQTTGANDGMLKGEFVAPVGTEYIVVNCNADYEENFLLEIKGELVHAVENYGTASQIFEQPIRRRSKDEPVRLCFFGNSWHMNTWWYLNKMLHSVGINAEMKCFYVGGSIFSQWVDYYKNNTAVDCWTSVDGCDWQNTKLKFADTLKEKWDVIAFQQGAYKALDWNNWSIYNELVSIIKRNCGVDTVIAFNVGWTPALQNENLAVYGNSPEGQKVWQEIDNHYTLRFMRMSGIGTVAPNGATMWSMRRNPQLNVANDMATDALHPDNGLPMYGLAGTWWQTYIAPMFGVDFSEVEWLPSTSTQKATVSGSSWQAISEEQREIIREIVKLSMSDRFGFNEV